MFDLEALIADCADAVRSDDPHRAVREVLARAMAQPNEVADRMQPTRAGITLLHHSPELTMLDLVWAPGMRVFPHDHQMWAAIGVYAGKEDNEFFRRDAAGGHLVPSNGRRIEAGDVVLLGDDTIHAVTNPARGATGAIHVYGGDFLNQPRSQWRGPDLVEEPYDADAVAQVFAEANEAWERARAS